MNGGATRKPSYGDAEEEEILTGNGSDQHTADVTSHTSFKPTTCEKIRDKFIKHFLMVRRAPSVTRCFVNNVNMSFR